jgi:hypothetical protein
MLREVIAKAARQPGSYGDLTLIYERGHELSGRTRFEARAGGEFTLRAENPRSQRTTAVEGKLDATQTARLFAAVEASRLLEIPPSTRNIGDDEQPIAVEIRYDDMEHRLSIWAGDAAANRDFQQFESSLLELIREVSGG